MTAVPMVSPKRATGLRKLGIEQVRDLVTHYPHRYLDMSRVYTIAQAPIGASCTLKAQIHDIKLKKPKRNLTLVEITLVDSTGTLIVTAFRQPWLMDSLKAGQTVAVSGKVEFGYGFKRMTNPYIEVLEGEGATFSGMVLPVHGLTGAIKAGLMRRLVLNALELIAGVEDPLPLELRTRYRLMSRQNALACIHFPQTMDEQREARRRLAYEEVLLLQLKLMQEGRGRALGLEPHVHRIDGPALKALAAAVPFRLTGEQEAAIQDILGVMAAPAVAEHMLLGDVGTGKTIVAAHALAAVADSDSQALFMAPTEILATQHAAGLGPLLDEAGVSWALLTGSTDRAERERILAAAKDGSLSVLFGTHALLEPDVELSRCSMAIIDEQQRFGVDQRKALLAKGSAVDSLYLTATPIPRTLALALYGNMTLSYLTERPQRSAPRKTFVHESASQGVAYDAAKAALARGEQVYVVCPLVGVKRSSAAEGEDDEDAYEYGDICIEDEGDMEGASLKAAEDEAAFLQAKVFTDSVVGLVHGKMPSPEKQKVMEGFRQGEVDVLVATTVIEVGVDVPNATVMIVQDADRFGLSQLHQLRGRVGRGEASGEVHLISGTRKQSALERLAVMERTDDGFELATYDLSLRREGDILGNRQHGASVLKLVNVVRDKGLIEAAWKDARAILEEDPELRSEAYKPLAREAGVVYRRSIDGNEG